MKMLKYFPLLLLVILLSGCTATYNLNIDKDVIKEEIKFSETKDELLTYSTSIYSFLEEELDAIKEEGTYNSYTMSIDTDNEYGSGRGIREYSNFENYKNSSIILTEAFSNVSVSDNDGIKTIVMTPNENFKYFEDNSQYDALLDEVKINITSTYKIVDSNSDTNTDDVYTWNIKKGEELKKIKISYDTNINITENIPIFVWVIIGVISLIAVIILYIYVRYKANSR